MGAANNSSNRGTAKARSGESFVAAQKRRQARQSMWWRIGITAVVALLAVGIGVGLLVGRGGNDAPVAAPSAFTSDGALVFDAQNVPTVSITEDFQCPACRQFEQTFGSTVDGLIDNGQARVEFRPVAILNRMTSDDYSSRSASASACVADESTTAWRAFKTELFDNQPAEGGGPGLSNDRLAELAVSAGATSPDTATCITEERYVPWADQMTSEATSNGLRGTPTVTVNGEQLSDMTPAGLLAAIAAAGQ